MVIECDENGVLMMGVGTLVCMVEELLTDC